MGFSEIEFMDSRMTLSDSKPRTVPHSEASSKTSPPLESYASGGGLLLAPRTVIQ